MSQLQVHRDPCRRESSTQVNTNRTSQKKLASFVDECSYGGDLSVVFYGSRCMEMRYLVMFTFSSAPTLSELFCCPQTMNYDK